jgi:hypothetical protein
MDVVSGHEEQFRQFQADELRRQTVAQESISRNVGTIKTLLLVLIVLGAAAGVLALIMAGQPS